MFYQLFLGSVITLLSLIGGTVLWWALSNLLEHMDPWVQRPPYAPKSMLVVMMVILSTMMMMTFGVWLWAIMLHHLHVFDSMEEAVFFALVAYTTLGLGDVSVPIESRLLGGMTGANGFLMFGLMTAMLTDALRHVRRVQHHLKD
jgi:hypothetical protein